MSLALYYQMVGRCLRPHPSKEIMGAFVVDMVGLSAQFGKVENLVVERNEKGLWEVTSEGRPLTNIYTPRPEPQFSFEKELAFSGSRRFA